MEHIKTDSQIQAYETFRKKIKENHLKKQKSQIEHHKTLPMDIDVSNWSDEQLEEGWINANPENTTEFKDIKWTKYYSFREDGYAYSLKYSAVISFDNEYYVSIINSKISDGKYFEYEMAIKDENGICFNHGGEDVPFAVAGHLSEEEVSENLKIISKLKKNK